MASLAIRGKCPSRFPRIFQCGQLGWLGWVDPAPGRSIFPELTERKNTNGGDGDVGHGDEGNGKEEGEAGGSGEEARAIRGRGSAVRPIAGPPLLADRAEPRADGVGDGSIGRGGSTRVVSPDGPAPR